MSGCFSLGVGRDPTLATTLRQLDCFSAQTAGGMFDRLGGALGSALTIALTIYVAWLAIGLLTGRSTFKLSALTPRMLGLGMILTLATSWAAYQTVVWHLLNGAPDQIASAILGTKGSATSQFADRLDSVFAAISASAKAAGTQVAAASPGAAQGSFTPSTMLWVAALLLLFGSLGILLVARIALTMLLALGPVFILFGLFPGTRGLLNGWIRTATMFSIAELLAVLIGGEALALLAPVVGRIAAMGTAPSIHDAVLMLLAAGVFVTLMAISLKAAATIVAGWQPTAVKDDMIDLPYTAPYVAAAREAALSGSVGRPGAEVAPIASDRARISGVVAAVDGRGVVRSLGAGATPARDAPAAILPSQTIVAHNRRSGDRLRGTTNRRTVSASLPARTLFR